MDDPSRGPATYGSLLEDPTRSSLGRARRARRRTIAAATIGALALVAGGAFAVTLLTRGTGPAGTDSVATATVSAVTSSAASASVAASVTPTAAVPASSSAGVAPEITIGWVGDTTPGSKYGNPPKSGKALFTSTREYTTVPDIMVANLEGTFGKGGPSKCGKDSTKCFAFQAPPKNAASLAWAGFDVVNLANNHSHDYLPAGVKSTKKALEDNDIAYTGLRDTVAIEETGGVKVAFLGFSPYSWSDDIADIAKAKKLVRAAAREADVVVVLIHAGAEGADKTHTPKGAERAFGEFRGNSRKFSHAVVDAGADVVLGSGPHVIRGMERYKGRLIAYSLGNFAGWGNFSQAGKLGLSGILTVRVAKDGSVRGGHWRSIKLADPGVPKNDAKKASLKLMKKLSKSDFASPVLPDSDGEFTFEDKGANTDAP